MTIFIIPKQLLAGKSKLQKHQILLQLYTTFTLSSSQHSSDPQTKKAKKRKKEGKEKRWR